MQPAPLRPHRPSLVTETVRLMHQAVEAGTWQDHLPGERTLCAQWQISRPTLRAAVEMLRREGLLEVAHGRRTRVLARHPASQPRSLTVGLLSPEPLHAMPPFVMLWLDELRGQLAAAGHLLHVHAGRTGFSSRNPSRALAAAVEDTPATVWMLYQATDAIKRWFAARQEPCMVVGSRVPGIDLPTVDRDYRAVCRHAVGLLAGRKLRRIALLIQQQQYGGDMESEAGFQEGLAAAARRGVTGEVLRHNGTQAGICKRLDDMLQHSPRPEALLVARSGYALTALTHLLKRGIRVPRDIALLCRDDDSFLDSTVPRVSRYAVSPSTFAGRVFRMVMHLVKQGQVRGSDVRVMPVLVERESL